MVMGLMEMKRKQKLNLVNSKENIEKLKTLKVKKKSKKK